MKRILTLLLLSSCAASAQVSVLPSVKAPYNQALPWGGNLVGVSNGVPNYTYSTSITNYGGVGNGSTDCTAALNSAISACTNGGYVWIPPGTWLLSTVVTIGAGKAIEIRGGDPNTTIIKSTASGTAAIDFSAGGVGATYTAANSGYTKGSVSVVVSSATGLSLGKTAHIKQSYDATIAQSGEAQPYCVLNQYVNITNINGTTIGFTPPLMWEFRSALLPQFGYYSTTPVKWAGLRGVTIYNTGSAAQSVRWWNFENCWVVNCILTNSAQSAFVANQGYRGEVRDSIMIGHQTYNNSDRYQINVFNFANNVLVQNNIGQGGNLIYNPQHGAMMNVFAYNFSDRAGSTTFNTSDTSQWGWGLCPHGDGDGMNLFEGNVIQSIKEDDFWGSNITNTYLRNWSGSENYVNLSGYSAYSSSGTDLEVDPQSRGPSFIGNVFSKFKAPSTTIYAFNNSTIFMHGNYDFVSQAAQWSNSITQTIPSSYYLASKPTWFGTLTWPPIGPDVATNNYGILSNHIVIPAQYRWYYGTNPPTSDPYISSQPVDTQVTTPASATFSVTAGGTSPFTYQWYRAGAAVGGNASTYNTGATTATTDQIYVSVANSFGTITSAVVTLTAGDAPTINTQPQSTSAVQGQSVTFTVAAAGTAPLTYQWKVNGTTIAGATSSSYNTNPITAGANGNSYTVVINNNFGTITSSAAVLTVDPRITVQPADQSTLAPSTVTFTVTAAGSGSVTYQWWRAGTNVTGQVASSYTTGPTALTDDGQIVYVVVTSAGGSLQSSNAVLHVASGTITPTPPKKWGNSNMGNGRY